jgi:hypothetical protein
LVFGLWTSSYHFIRWFWRWVFIVHRLPNLKDYGREDETFSNELWKDHRDKGHLFVP